MVRHAALGAKPKLFVAERFVGVAGAGAPEWATFVAEARRISSLASANVGRVRELTVRGDDLIAFWDFIDGEALVETWLSSMPLEVSLRMVLDVLSGVGAIHGLRDTKQRPMGIAHGELSTATIVVGLDGSARVCHGIARRMPGARPADASIGYLAPEVHAGQAYDATADVFSAGVLLWEAMSGRRLFSEGEAAAIVGRVRGGGIPPAAVRDGAAWTRPLVAVAAKALAPSPGDRWPSASAMAAEIRKAVGLKLASATAAGAFAKSAMGERAKARREELESGLGVARMPELGAVATTVPEVDRLDADIDLVAASVPPPAPVSLVPEPIDDAVVADQSPPPLPERAPRAARPVAAIAPQSSGDDANMAQDFAAAIDVPISIAPPPSDPFEVSPTSIETTGSFDPHGGATRRRRVAVLGGVGAFGLVVFALAGWRATHRDPETSAASHDRPRVMAVRVDLQSAARPARPPASAPERAPVAAPPPAPIHAAAPTPAVAAGASRTPESPPPASSASAPKPGAPAVASQKPPSPPPARPKPRSNSGYDPGAL